MATEKKYIKVHSTITITINAGLRYINKTTDNGVGDRLKIQESWSNSNVTIYEGTRLYPAEIANWESFKTFQKKGTFVILDNDADKSSASSEETENLDKDEKSVGSVQDEKEVNDEPKKPTPFKKGSKEPIESPKPVGDKTLDELAKDIK